MMKNNKRAVLHILSSGDTGGIEILCKEYAKHSKNNNIFSFFLGVQELLLMQCKKQVSM